MARGNVFLKLHWNEKRSLDSQYPGELLTNAEQICRQLHCHMLNVKESKIMQHCPFSLKGGLERECSIQTPIHTPLVKATAGD